MKKSKGISLIVLIITIIVVIILATIIILSFSQNNPIKKAQEAKFKTEVSQFKEELLMTHANKLAENKRYKSQNVNVDVGDYSTMKTYIPSITEDYVDRLYIKNGELAYVDKENSEYDEDEYEWASELGIKKSEVSGAKKAAADPTTYYGARVTNYTANGISDWRIFYSDGSNIYLITSDYIDPAKLPSKDVAKPANTNSDYPKAAPFDNIITKYSGSSNITDEKMKAFNSDYFEKEYTSTNNNMKAVAYMLDKDIWGDFVNSSVAEYAVGGPSVEMLLKSYSEKNNVDYRAQASSATGYQVSNNGGTSYANYIGEMLSTGENLYVLPQNKGANAMWLASPSAYHAYGVVGVTYNGYVSSNGYADTTVGFRPLVCLNSNILLNEVSGGFEIE